MLPFYLLEIDFHIIVLYWLAYSGEDQPDTAVTERIGDESRVLLTHFISVRIRRESHTDVDETQFFAPNTPTGLLEKNTLTRSQYFRN